MASVLGSPRRLSDCIHNVLATAFANKLARIAWSVLAEGRNYEARIEVPQA